MNAHTQSGLHNKSLFAPVCICPLLPCVCLRSELSKLTVEKALINFLSMLAADYKAEFPEEVVGAIAARVQQHPLKGLACLYLLDSIIKNVRDPYPKLFQNVIVPLMRRLTEEVHPHHLCTDSFPAGSFFVVPKAAIHTKNTHISVRRIPFLFFQEDIFIARRCVTLNVLGAARSMRVRAFMGNYNGFTQRCESKCWKTGKRRKKSRLSSKHKKITACICRSSLQHLKRNTVHCIAIHSLDVSTSLLLRNHPFIHPYHLLQATLNSQPLGNDPSSIQEPNHTSLNHLYALSVKDNVMVLGQTNRFKSKYVTTIWYVKKKSIRLAQTKPIYRHRFCTCYCTSTIDADTCYIDDVMPISTTQVQALRFERVKIVLPVDIIII